MTVLATHSLTCQQHQPTYLTRYSILLPPPTQSPRLGQDPTLITWSPSSKSPNRRRHNLGDSRTHQNTKTSTSPGDLPEPFPFRPQPGTIPIASSRQLQPISLLGHRAPLDLNARGGTKLKYRLAGASGRE